MAKKEKYYAVAEGRGVVPNIYTSWDECKEVVGAYKGAKYKSFKTSKEAIVYLAADIGISLEDIVTKCEHLKKYKSSLDKQESSQIVNNIKDDRIRIYVDGSFKEGINSYAYGFVVVLNDEVLHYANGVGHSDGAVALRNVAGEMTGAMRAVNYAIKNQYKKIQIYYDYQGLECWAKGTWKRKNEYTKKYHEFMTEKMQHIEIDFVKVKAHSGETYNDMADVLAKNALMGIEAKNLKINTDKKIVKR